MEGKYEKFSAILILALALVLLASCANIKQPAASSGITTALVEKDYEVLGRVKLEAKVTNILGMFSFGGKGYADLLEAAIELYPETDDVINVYVDNTGSTILGVYNTFGKVLTGTAIKYVD